MANIHRDEDKKPEPFTVADFLPGAKSDEEEMQEFAEAVMRGDSFEVDPEQVEKFKRRMVTEFGNVRTMPQPSSPSQPPPHIRTNAIAGDKPRRGVQ
jgi:hypothetical protein